MAAVQAESLEALEKANVPPGQAWAIVRAIEIEIGGAKDVLATKQDVQLARQDLRQEIQLVRQELRQEIQVLRDDMSAMRHDLEMKIEGVHIEIHSTLSSLTRHLYGAIFGSMTAVLTFTLGMLYFLFAHFSSLK